MSQQNSGKFFFGSVVTFLILFGLVKLILNTSSEATSHIVAPESMEEAAVAERIKPVAELNIGEAPAVVAPPVEVASTETTGAGGAGADIYNSVCMTCHASGLMNAPKYGDAADWAPRLEKGIDTLHTHAINGFNMMPAKGGRADLSDEDVMAAVDYMVDSAK